ncbi:MAG: hypothetical protein KF745_02180 [Phycisphaeraceae bacterium]|nr:hypothetical protein [Phycisphaeraceae bacterium]
MINDLTTSGALPALEMVVRFAGQRQRLIAHNIANLDTPNFQPREVSAAGFQRTLRDAVEQRRATTGGEAGELPWRESRELRRDSDGGLSLQPGTPSSGLLFHDRNNRDMERQMQAMVENVSAFRIGTDLLRSRFAILQSAIQERA